MYDLLTDPLIGVRTSEGERRLNLPELLAGLSAGHIEGYTGLRPHQADPWHVFLVQLAASVQARNPTETLPADQAYWRDGLLALADGLDTAWHLVVEDVTKPAFLQHPWKSWQAEAADYGVKTVRGKTVFEPKARTPDKLDILITARNHDVKMARMGGELIEAWLYSLVIRQTMSAYGGPRTYGITRMNSGSGSRAIVAWVSSLHPSRRFAEEVSVLQKLRNPTIAAYGFLPRGVVLTWLSSWSRQQHQYTLRDLEPWFVEAARPSRLVLDSGALVALGATSGDRQIGPTEPFNGDVGDPWIPVNLQDKKKGQSALTVSEGGFTPSVLTKLLFQDGFKLTGIQLPRAGQDSAWFVASVLVGGNCTTDGFHRIELPVPPKARLALLNPQRRDTLAHLAQHLLTDVKEIQGALGAALTVFVEGGPDKADFDRDAVKHWVKRARADFGQRWEYSYFDTLWRGADENHETVRRDWQQQRVDDAQAVLDEAAMRLPLPSSRRWRASAQAQSAWHGRLRKLNLPTPGRASTEPTHTEETIA